MTLAFDAIFKLFFSGEACFTGRSLSCCGYILLSYICLYLSWFSTLNKDFFFFYVFSNIFKVSAAAFTTSWLKSCLALKVGECNNGDSVIRLSVLFLCKRGGLLPLSRFSTDIFLSPPAPLETRVNYL